VGRGREGAVFIYIGTDVARGGGDGATDVHGYVLVRNTAAHV
jgi:hypothetical protein